jgi:hypothetical protein
MTIKELTLSESNQVKQMTDTPGWNLIAKEIKRIQETNLQKLRKCNRDSAFYKIQGCLDFIDEFLNVIDYKLNQIYEEE